MSWNLFLSFSLFFFEMSTLMYATLKRLQIETYNFNFLLFKYNQKAIKKLFSSIFSATNQNYHNYNITDEWSVKNL